MNAVAIGKLFTPQARLALVIGLVVLVYARSALSQEFRKVEIPAVAPQIQGIESVSGLLYTPKHAQQPVPAVVFLHGCNGVVRSHYEKWARWYAQNRYAFLGVDSLAPRGIKPGRSACAEDMAKQGLKKRGYDALSALRYLARLPQFDPKRIFVQGHSHGGSTAVEVVRDMNRPEIRMNFAASIAFYPLCFSGPIVTVAPLLILTGGRDDYNPPGHCQRMVRRSKKTENWIELHNYPTAGHSFDSDFPVRREKEYGGAYMGGDPAAYLDSLDRILDFLQKVMN